MGFIDLFRKNKMNTASLQKNLLMQIDGKI